MSIRNFGFRQRFLLIGLVFLVGYGALLWVARDVLAHVMVNGALYNKVRQNSDLIADIMPPPKFIMESYLLCFLIASEDDVARRGELELRLASAQQEYEDRSSFWGRTLRGSGEMHDLLLVDSHTPATEFYKVVNDQFLPAVGAPFSTEKSPSEILIMDLLPLFNAHRAAVTQAVALSKEEIKAREQEAKEAVESGRTTAFVVALIVIFVVGLVGTLVLRSVLSSLGALIARMREMAQSEANLARRIEVDSRDEAGQLAHWINQFIQKIADLVAAVRRSSVQLTSTSTEMAATSREQESTVQSFGASTSQIAAAVQQINATGAELFRALDELSRTAQSSAVHASQGRSGLGAMGRTMSQLQQSSSSISEKLAVISEKAGDITTVVTTITKVADQTNLLSVNAAIEAEKAGEYGRGFLVVAQEIRRLADQTATATLDIEKTVSEMGTAVSAGVMEMDKFADRVRRSVQDVAGVSESLGLIIGQVEDATSRIASVKDGMSSQAKGAAQINEAMHGLSESVQHTMTSVHEFTSAAEDLRGSADALKAQLSAFRLED